MKEVNLDKYKSGRRKLQINKVISQSGSKGKPKRKKGDS